MNQMMKRVERDEATLALAASVADRAREILSEGWLQNELYTEHRDQCCIHGAIYVALEEMFGQHEVFVRTHTDGARAVSKPTIKGQAVNVEALVTAFVAQQAQVLYGYQTDDLFAGAARFNDAPERTLEEVLKVMGTAAGRLWEAAMGEVEGQTRSWADDESVEPALAYA